MDDPIVTITQDEPMQVLDPKICVGNVTFTDVDGNVILLIRRDGKVLVRGEEVANNKEVYRAFCKWLGIWTDFDASSL